MKLLKSDLVTYEIFIQSGARFVESTGEALRPPWQANQTPKNALLLCWQITRNQRWPQLAMALV